VLFGAVARVMVAGNLPLWLDEAWTGGIAGQPSWTAVIHQIWLDANAPLYGLLMHGWMSLFGSSNAAMRTPSLIIGILTPLVPLLFRIDGWKAEDRLSLGVMLAVWSEGVLAAQEARCYPLLLLLATCQTLAFAKLLTAPSLKQASLWAGLGSLVILTHYQALALGAVQGLIYLRVHQMRAVRTWPAAFGFAPAFGVIAWHLPRLLQFARPDVAWYPLVTSDVVAQVFYFFVPTLWLYVLPLLGGVFIVWRYLRKRPLASADMASEALWLAGFSGLLGVMLIAGIGMWRPSFAVRYATPYTPAVLMLVVMCIRGLGAVFPAGRAAFLLMALVHSANWAGNNAGRLWRYYTYEIASQDLLATGPTRLVFLWDHPAQKVEDPSQYVAAGGFFFRRAGSPAEVTPVLIRAGEDPNRRLLAEAKSPGSVILWLYDREIRGTAELAFPEQISRLDPSFGCKNYGRRSIGVVACSRSWAK
jgi:hypothetical protein